MAEKLPPKASVTAKKPTTEEMTLHVATEKCKKLFGSALWHYPIHKFIGDIVQS